MSPSRMVACLVSGRAAKRLRSGGVVRKALGRQDRGLAALFFPVLRRAEGGERIDERRGCVADLLHGQVEGRFVGLRWRVEAAQLTDELHGGGADFVVRRRRGEVE